MFRALVIAVEIAALIFVMQSSFMQYLLSDWQSSAADWMVEYGKRKERREMADFRAEVLPNLQDVKQYQRDYLNDVMSSKVHLQSFYQAYCQQGDKNPFIQGVNLHLMCSQIDQKKAQILGP